MVWPDDLPEATAPWRLHGRVFVFLTHLGDAPLPPGSRAELEHDLPQGKRLLGPGAILLIRYSDSPVGPYDELIWLSGRRADPAGRSGFSIERIYVSTEASTANGRRNWSIPKHVAEFRFEPADPGDEPFAVSLRLPGSTTPFFAARVRPPTIAPRLGVPFTTDVLLGAFRLVQPALKSGSGALLGSQQFDPWRTVSPTLSGGVRLASIEPLLPSDGDAARRYGNSVAWPDVRPLGVGFTLRSCAISFPAAV